MSITSTLVANIVYVCRNPASFHHPPMYSDLTQSFVFSALPEASLLELRIAF